MKLLIVDDEIYTIQGMIDSIDWNRFAFDKILTANSYAQAINLFIKDKIDILLCDIEMPYGSGLDLVEWVKKNYPDTECIFLTCHDEFDFARQAISLRALDYVLKPANPEKITEVLRKAVGTIQSKMQSQKYEEYGKRYVETISSQNGEEEEQRPRDIVKEAKRYVQENIAEPLTVERIAAKFFVSPDHLTRLFKKQQGQTLIDYIINQRMILAKTLIEKNELTITMISAKVGYNNYSYFTKIFKRVYGESPREYQARISNRNRGERMKE